MSFIKITLELDGRWVLTHRTDNMLPIKAFISFCSEAFAGKIEVDDSTLTGCTLIIKDEELNGDAVNKKINDILAHKLEINASSEIAKVTITDVEPSNDEDTADDDAAEAEESENETSEEKKPEKETSEDDKSESSISDFLNAFGQSAAEEKTEEKPLKERIDSLIGAEEFKALVSEIELIAPKIKKYKTFEAFAYQSYLFAINDGCGLSTYLNLLAELIEVNGLFKFRENQKVIEEKLDLPTNDKFDPFIPILSNMRSRVGSGGRLISIDISEWMTKLSDKQFRGFLSDVENRSAENIVVFVIPFVERDVLEDIKASLEDIFFIRQVSVPPFDTDELTECAKRSLTRFGYTAEDESWKLFEARIMEEKNDGRFYGMNTVNKVVREMIYRKQLTDALNGKDDSVIKTDDVSSLSKTYNSDTEDGMSALDNMVGMERIKSCVEEILTQIELSRSNKSIGYPCIHMRFVGSPGTGKTTVARIIGRILKDRGVLRNGYFFEYSGRDFCGRYVGETAPKTAAMCRDAYGSVLFIDEAYSLYRDDDNGRDYGREALDTLIAEMENHRNDLVVIMAGYTDEMALLMKGNTGLESRMPYVIEFPNYTREQLCEIYFKMVGDDIEYDEDFKAAVAEYFDAINDDVLGAKDFSNARFVRNLFERTCVKAGTRKKFDKSEKFNLTREDFRLASSESAFRSLVTKKTKARIGY